MQEKNIEHCQSQFHKDISRHEMRILLDEGRYRHLLFKKPDCGSYWFQIVTWPGYLAISGDMGEFMFSRLKDMFEFFRGEGSISFGYWAEKCRAGKVRAFSRDLLIESVIEYLEDSPQSEKERARELLQFADSEHEAFEIISDEFQSIDLCDFREESYKDYDYSFLWCCFAIRWAISKYDEKKEGVA